MIKVTSLTTLVIQYMQLLTLLTVLILIYYNIIRLLTLLDSYTADRLLSEE